ncbi:hypothetical protein L596_017242 [Steinernema carpocapsae]|uniref:Protein phosphatase n=1 Tax=Steinernema carpocapsae TaxID=34508 RepID=A0A4U5N194_STECR|nr:hypothetical protein L596_017242 [Steinernema carpocapsae]
MLRKQLLTCGRLAFRAVVTAGVVDAQSLIPPDCHPKASTAHRKYATTAKEAQATPTASTTSPGVISHCCGFPKNMVNGPSTVRDEGVIGEDACFMARYRQTHVCGVADGVGGWRKYGIDPSEFSNGLMKRCSDLVNSGEFVPSRPDLLIAKAFQQLASSPPRPIGSSTACVLIIDQDKLYSANLGDSGYLVMRKGRVIYRSNEQTHYFNAPFQLCLLPEEAEDRPVWVFDGGQNEAFRQDCLASGVWTAENDQFRIARIIGDAPEKADLAELSVESGDLVVLATDGLWDNVPEQLIVEQLNDVKPENVQAKCNGLALTARRLAFDDHHNSPFAVKAKQNGIHAPGGKPDDITLVLILIA